MPVSTTEQKTALSSDQVVIAISAVGQRFDRVEDEVHEDFTQRRRITGGGRNLPGLQAQVDLDASDLGFRLPARSSHLDDFFGQLVQLDRDPFRHGLGPAEHAHAADDLAGVEHAALGDLEVTRDLAFVFGAAKRDLHAPEDDGEEVVQMMGDPGGELADGAQPLGLDDAAVGALELLVHGDQLAAAPPIGFGQQRGERTGGVHEQQVEAGHAPVGSVGASDRREPADVLDQHDGQVGQRGCRRRDDAGHAREHEPGVERHQRVHTQIRRGCEPAGAIETEGQQPDVGQHPRVREHAARASRPGDEKPWHIDEQAGERRESDDRADREAQADGQDLGEEEDDDRHAGTNHELLHHEPVVAAGFGEGMILVSRWALDKRAVRDHYAEVIGTGGDRPEG